MRRVLIAPWLLFTCACASGPAASKSLRPPDYGHLPLQFEPARDRALPGIDYLAHADGYELLIGRSGVVLQSDDQGVKAEMTQVLLTFAGANPASLLSGSARMPGTINYLLGNDPSKWRRNIPTYSRVRYQEIYPSIDVVFFGDRRTLEYDLVVRPGGNPDLIALKIDGVNGVRLDGTGDLVIDTAFGSIRHRAPTSFQELSGRRLPVQVHYSLAANGDVNLIVGPYERTAPLIIDPEVTADAFVGGGWRSVAVDSTGNFYLSGGSISPVQLTSPGIFEPPQSCRAKVVTCFFKGHLFVMKLAADAKTVLYTTYLGSGTCASVFYAECEYGGLMRIDAEGNVLVAGNTTARDFPRIKPIQADCRGAFERGLYNGFLMKLDATGSDLVYSTCLGGDDPQTLTDLAVDRAGNAYVTGYTWSANYPVFNAIQPNNRGPWDAFVTKVDPTGRPVYSTYLGGQYLDFAYGIAADDEGQASIVGATASTDFPTVNAFQKTYAAGLCTNRSIPCYDAFVAKLNATGSLLIFSTYLGGRNDEAANAVGVDPEGNTYVAGRTASADFPTTGAAFKRTCGQNNVCEGDAFVTAFDRFGRAIYSTFLGGSSTETVSTIAVDRMGNAFVGGRTESQDFPWTRPIVVPQKRSPESAAFLAKLDAAGCGLDFATDIPVRSGHASDVFDVAVDHSGSLYVVGRITDDAFGYSAFVGAGFFAKIVDSLPRQSWTARPVSRCRPGF